MEEFVQSFRLLAGEDAWTVCERGRVGLEVGSVADEFAWAQGVDPSTGGT
jgi:hypothetical protein